MRVVSQSLYPRIRNVLESRPKTYVSGLLRGKKRRITWRKRKVHSLSE